MLISGNRGRNREYSAAGGGKETVIKFRWKEKAARVNASNFHPVQCSLLEVTYINTWLLSRTFPPHKINYISEAFYL